MMRRFSCAQRHHGGFLVEGASAVTLLLLLMLSHSLQVADGWCQHRKIIAARTTTSTTTTSRISGFHSLLKQQQRRIRNSRLFVRNGKRGEPNGEEEKPSRWPFWENLNGHDEHENSLSGFTTTTANGSHNHHHHSSTTTSTSTHHHGPNDASSSLTHVIILQEENKRLREAVYQLQQENERLHQEFDNRIILELFEGEGKIKRSQQAAAAESALVDSNDHHLTLTQEEIMLQAAEAAQPEPSTSDTFESDATTSGSSRNSSNTELLEKGACPIEPTVSFGEALRDRAYWLVGLLILQSCSGIILAQNEALLANHPVIVYFLTMLVGAGGNAGNQASVRVIRGLALGTLNAQTQGQFLTRELKMAVALSAILSAAGFVRAAIFQTPLAETIAVTAALSLIVFTSVCLGAVLPLLLKKVGVDPAHSSTSIQVVMDILGVLLAVLVSSVLLDSPLGALLISKLSFLPSA